VCTSQQSLRPFIVIGIRIREEDGWGLCVSGARRHMDGHGHGGKGGNARHIRDGRVSLSHLPASASDPFKKI